MNFRYLSAWSIRNPIVPIVLFIGLVLAGLVSFNRMDVNGSPDIDFPAVNVNISQPGAAPTEIETQITQKVEAAVRSINGVDEITSTASEGSSSTFVQFAIGVDSNVAVNEVKNAVDQVRSDLPDGILEPQVSKVEVGGNGPIGFFAIAADDMTMEQLSWFVDDTVSRRLLSIEGMAAVGRNGGVDREIRVILDPARMQSLGVTASQVNTALRSVNTDAAGGRAEIAGSRQSVRVLGNADTARQLGETEVSLGAGRTIKLSDIAQVYDGYSEQTNIAKLNGRQVVTFGIERAKGASDVTVYEAALEEIEALQSENPGVHITQLFTSVEYTKDQYETSMEAMIEGAVLAILVVFLFLRDWRATWISAIALPLSIVPTFYVMMLFDIGLNTLTLLALSLVVGLLVDDAIVEVENIVRHLREGKTPKRAALDAAQEIGLAVIGTSLTLVAIFIPVAFMPGIPGQFFKQFALTCVVSVVLSLIVARLITPMLAAYQLKAIPDAHKDGPALQKYLQIVHWTLKNRGKTLLGALGLFVLSIVAYTTLPGSFLEAEDNGELSISVTLPPGSSMQTTHRAVEQLQQLLASYPEVRSVYSNVSINTAVVNAQLLPRSNRQRSQQQIQQALTPQFAQVAGARISVAGRGFGQNMNVTLVGDDAELLNETAAQVESQLRSIGMTGIDSSAALVQPEITITPDFEKAAKLGITSTTLSDAIRIGTTGDIDNRLSKLSLPTRQIPIRVQIDPEQLKSIDNLRLLPIPAGTGTVPLEAVAKIELASGAAQISRYNRHRNVTLSIPMNGQALTTMLTKVQAVPALQKLPPGISLQRSGDLERQQELTGGFQLAMIAGIFCVYAVLALLFNDLLQPITILLALPLSIGGAVVALKFGGYSLSVASYIGILMLMGIAVKNSILLVDYTVIGEERGLTRSDALVDACAKRARPIIMTSIAMGVGMMPTAFDFSGTNTFRAPMGLAVLGGLFTSTILSLLVIPAAYTYVGDFEAWFRRMRHRFG